MPGVEYVHHVDRADRVLGRVSREEAHARGLLHRAGCVLLFDSGGRVCVARRSPRKTIFAECWDWACSFHVSWGEGYAEAAKRELEEETGIVAVPQELGTVLVDEPPDHLIVRVYQLNHDGPVRLDPVEAHSAAFVEPRVVNELVAEGPTTSWLPPAWELSTTLGGTSSRAKGAR